MFSLVSTVRTGARACAQSAHSAGPGQWGFWRELSEVLFGLHLIPGLIVRERAQIWERVAIVLLWKPRHRDAGVLQARVLKGV